MSIAQDANYRMSDYAIAAGAEHPKNDKVDMAVRQTLRTFYAAQVRRLLGRIASDEPLKILRQTWLEQGFDPTVIASAINLYETEAAAMGIVDPEEEVPNAVPTEEISG